MSNANKPFSTEKLRSLMDGENGHASTNRFKVELPIINGTPKPGGGAASTSIASEDLNLLCTAARLPGTQINTIDRQIGMEPKKIAVGRVTTDVSLTFYLTNKYSAREYWQEWMDCVASPTAPFMAGYLGTYGKDVKIQQLDRFGDPVYKVKLIKAYPINLSEVEFNNQANTSGAEFTVTLAYPEYEIY